MLSKQKLSLGQFSESSLYDWGDMAGRPTTAKAPPFGQRLAALRKARGFSQQELAGRLKTTRANIAYYERKASNPTLDFISRCAEVFEVPVAELADLAPTPSPARAKPGPKSRLEQQFEKISKLPRTRQQFVSQVLDELLSSSSDS
jgi:transcriptional regulator with XRE-family HTH domain